MKNIAFTWVFNDMVALDLWARYYSRYFDELLVLCCATKPEYDEKLKEMGEKYNLRAERLEAEEFNSPMANRIIMGKQQELLKDHKWVLYCNCDEIITTRPDRYKDLKDFMGRYKGKWLWCICYEILQEEGEPWLDYSKPILRQRKSWLKNPSLNKVLLSRVPLSWNDGQHQIEETKAMVPSLMKNRGLYLLHLKHADYNAPNRDYVADLRPKFTYVLENFEHRGTIPEELRDVV